MTVEHLINELQKLDPKAEVVVATSNFEQGNSDVIANHIYAYNGKIRPQTFTDAFDHESYTKDMPLMDETGDRIFVKIS